jgi:hypothetical protein
MLRDERVSSLVAGDRYDPAFLSAIEKDETGKPKNPVVIGGSSVFWYHDPPQPQYFSAYVNERGTLRVFFMGWTGQGGRGSLQLQARWSHDRGQNWYDLWEHIEHGDRRIRVDPDAQTVFIDTASTEEEEESSVFESFEQDPQERGQPAELGINVHWSRLAIHKVSSESEESKVMPIDSPYAFYQSGTNQVFLFYIYNECLLCKVFDDGLFEQSYRYRSDGKGEGMSQLKQYIEQTTMAHFIDGNLTGTIRDELQDYAYTDVVTGETKVVENGNIIFLFHFAIDIYNNERAVSEQRIIACELPNGNVRVFYTHRDSSNLRAAVWNGLFFAPEDLLQNIEAHGHIPWATVYGLEESA